MSTDLMAIGTCIFLLISLCIIAATIYMQSTMTDDQIDALHELNMRLM